MVLSQGGGGQDGGLPVTLQQDHSLDPCGIITEPTSLQLESLGRSSLSCLRSREREVREADIHEPLGRARRDKKRETPKRMLPFHSRTLTQQEKEAQRHDQNEATDFLKATPDPRTSVPVTVPCFYSSGGCRMPGGEQSRARAKLERARWESGCGVLATEPGTSSAPTQHLALKR